MSFLLKSDECASKKHADILLFSDFPQFKVPVTTSLLNTYAYHGQAFSTLEENVTIYRNWVQFSFT